MSVPTNAHAAGVRFRQATPRARNTGRHGCRKRGLQQLSRYPCWRLLLHAVLAAAVIFAHAADTGEDAQANSRPATVAPHAYHSLGQVPGFIGPVLDPNMLRAALDKCTFKRELILLSVSDGSYDAAYQTMDALRKWGLVHVMLVAANEEVCRVAAAIDPWKEAGKESTLCCVWATPRVPSTNSAKHAFGEHRFLMHVRMRIATRALRLRYNILFLDTDLCIFDNPYTYLKAPPFSRINLMYAADAQLTANIGVMYVQNVAPNGPVIWTFAEMADRQLRWSEWPSWFEKNKTDVQVTNPAHIMWDQPNFSDAALSTVVGFPIFNIAWSFQRGKQELEWLKQHADLVNQFVRVEKTQLSGRISIVANQKESSEMSMKVFPMRHPATNGTWPLKWGGVGYPSQRGRFSIEWLDLLRGQAPDVPLWPDHERPLPACTAESVVAAEASTKAGEPLSPGCVSPTYSYKEYGGIFPNFFVHSWWGRKQQNDWDVRAQPPTQVIGHNLYMPNDKRVYKNVLKMTYGHYNWTMAAALKRALLQSTPQHMHSLSGAHKGSHQKVIKASAKDIGSALRGPKVGLFLSSTPENPMPDVLRPSSVLPLADMRVTQLVIALHHLVAASVVTGRAFAWPALPCDQLNRVIQEMEQADNKWLFANRRTYMTGVVPFPQSKQPLGAYALDPKAVPDREVDTQDTSTQVCLWYEYMLDPCLAYGVGMLAVESEVYDRHFPPPTNLSGPHAQRTWHPMGHGNTVIVEPLAPQPAPPGSGQPKLPQQWLPLEPAGKLDHEAFQALFTTTTVAAFRQSVSQFNGTKAVYVDKIPFLVDAPSMRGALGVAGFVLHQTRAMCRALPVPDKLRPYLSGALSGTAND